MRLLIILGVVVAAAVALLLGFLTYLGTWLKP